MSIIYVNKTTLNAFFGTKKEGDQHGVGFKELTWEVDSLQDFADEAPEGTCWTSAEGEQYFKIRNLDGDCEVFYFEGDNIKQL